MNTITLKQIHKDIAGLKKEMKHMRILLEEDFELSDEVIKEIEGSRKRAKAEFISHEEMKKEFV